jgi:hypothetical protein
VCIYEVFCLKSSAQIFISHSSNDTKLIELITLAFKDREIQPYFARRSVEAENPVNKIVNAIDNSYALFALITPNVVFNVETRDWCVFEIAVAKHKGIPIFCWIDKLVEGAKNYPKLMENITTYDTFQSFLDDDCYRVIKLIMEKAFEAKGIVADFREPTKNELETGLIQMEEAKKVAIEFVRNEKKEGKIEVSSIEPMVKGWRVKGSISQTFKNGFGSERWTVDVGTTGVSSYKFEPGGSIFFG